MARRHSQSKLKAVTFPPFASYASTARPVVDVRVPRQAAEASPRANLSQKVREVAEMLERGDVELADLADD